MHLNTCGSSSQSVLSLAPPWCKGTFENLRISGSSIASTAIESVTEVTSQLVWLLPNYHSKDEVCTQQPPGHRAGILVSATKRDKCRENGDGFYSYTYISMSI